MSISFDKKAALAFRETDEEGKEILPNIFRRQQPTLLSRNLIEVRNSPCT